MRVINPVDSLHAALGKLRGPKQGRLLLLQHACSLLTLVTS